MRKTGACMNCGEIRDMAAHGLCFTCYRRDERADDNKFRDRHNPAIRREYKKLFRGFTSVMVGLSELGVQRSDVLTIRRLLEPYVAPIAEFLASPAALKEAQTPVNGEQEPERTFTVHTSHSSGEGQQGDGESGLDDLEGREGLKHEIQR
jgi:hypothetical protein